MLSHELLQLELAPHASLPTPQGKPEEQTEKRAQSFQKGTRCARRTRG